MSHLLENAGESAFAPVWNVRDWFSVEGDVDDFIFYEPEGSSVPPDDRCLK